MSKEWKSIEEEYRKATNANFISVIRGLGDINKRLQGIASETVVCSAAEINKGLQGIASEMTEHSRRCVGRAFEIQAQFARKAYDTYISEVTKLGQMMFAGYGTLFARTEEEFLNGRSQLAFRSAAQRTAAHSVTAKRKTAAAKRANGKQAKKKR